MNTVLGGETVSVLLIEDDEHAREVLEGVLKATGLSVFSVQTGDEAVELFEQGWSFDLLVTDIRLPGRLDGWSTAVEARQFNPNISVIYMTASHQQSCPVTRSVFLRKPLRPTLFLEIVGTLLNRPLNTPAKALPLRSEARIGAANYLH